MQLHFRQGIVKAPSGFLVANGSSVDLATTLINQALLAFADRDANYLVVEKAPISQAWVGPFIPSTNYWLYWDINARTGALTRSHTTVEPVFGPAQPLTPVNNLHWFDTNSTTMFYWSTATNRWIRCIRLFATKYNGSFTSMSINSPAYDGTQVGNTTTSSTGYIVFDESGTIIKRSNDTLFTTETISKTGANSAFHVKLSSVILNAQAQTTIPAYTIVKFTAPDQVVSAPAYDSQQHIFGITDTDAITGQDVQIITEGVIQNNLWNWSAYNVGTPLYVTTGGTLTVNSVGLGSAIAYVLNSTSIYFKPLITTPGPTGVGIVSIVRTAGTGAAATTDTYTISFSNSTTTTFNVRNGEIGPQGIPGLQGPPGVDPILAQSRSGLDGNNIFTIVEWRRGPADLATLYRRSVLSGGTSPQYTTRTETLFALNGTTVLSTTVFNLTYSGGVFVSEVIA